MKNKRPIIFYLVVIFLLLISYLIVKNTNADYIDAIWNSDTEYISIENGGIESCLHCHANTKGYSKYHNPETIGCASCHLGNTETINKEDSHQGMILIPGNLSDAKETCGKCHPNELHKIENSLMTTNSGLVAVDKYIFGEADSPNYHCAKLLRLTDRTHYFGACGASFFFGGAPQRNHDREFRSPVRTVPDTNPSPVRFNNLVRDRQAEPGSPVLCRKERHKQVF